MGAGQERVEDAEQALAVGVVEFCEGGEAFGEAMVVDVQRAAGLVVEDEVVEADVEGLGQAGDGVQRRGDAAVFVAADLAGVGGADTLRELGLGEAEFAAEFFDAVAEGHEVACRVVVWPPFCPRSLPGG